MKFIYINEFGDVLPVAHEGDSTLTTLQALVGGYVDLVAADPDRLGFTADVWVNDEGLYDPRFIPNGLISHLTGYPLVGPAVITRSDSDGNTVGLTDADIATLKGSLLVDERVWTVDEVAALLRYRSVDAPSPR